MSRSRGGRGGIGKGLMGLVLLVALLIFVQSVHLAREVRVKFEGKRWAEPARVYARALELYPGAEVSAAQLEAELRRLGYRRVSRVSAVAQWSRSKGRFQIHRRPFSFDDGPSPALRLEVVIQQGRVVRLRDLDKGRSLELARLEAPLIGSLYSARNEDRVLVKRRDLPDSLVAALLAVEDRDFYQHHGLNPRSILRALVANLRAGRTVQGGSTLTQQLVKNFWLTPERSLWRKFNEALMALILEARYDKDEILEAYANEVYLGQDGARAIHGFGLAAWFYFGRPLQELALHETALLVALLKGASRYDPRRHPERARQRRNLVLRLMAEQGFIDPRQARVAQQQPLGVVPKPKVRSRRPSAFLQLVKRQLRRDYRETDLTSEGLRIFTTLDPWLQERLERQLATGLAELEKRHRRARQLQGAVVLVAPQQGELRALVGGRNSSVMGFNRALDAQRPIGSLIKPLVYLSALSRPDQYTLITPLEDRPIEVPLAGGRTWRPRNYDGKAHGRVPLHRALANSYNLATVALGLALGLDELIELLQRMGLARPVEPLPSLLLGALALSPLEVAQLYQVLASGGFRAPLRAIRGVTDGQGRPLKRYALAVRQVIDPKPLYLLTRNLVEVMRQGTGKGIQRWLPSLEVAGKTGTTNDLRDSWFAGFSADWLAVVWVGRDDNRPAGLTGASGAMAIWGRIMRALDPEPLAVQPPPGVSYFWIDPETGRLSAETCPGALAMPCIEGSEPRQWADCPGPPAKAEPSFFERWFH